MKNFYAILCICAVIVHSYASPDRESYKECLAESGIKEENLESLKNAKDDRLRCIMACVLEKEGIIIDDEIDDDAMKDSLIEEIDGVDKKIATEVMDTCMDMAKDIKDICDISNIVGVCIKAQLDKMNIKFEN